MVDGKGHQPDLTLGDCRVAGAVVAQEHDVVVEIHGVELGEAAAAAEEVHDFHGDDVFDLAFARHGDAVHGE